MGFNKIPEPRVPPLKQCVVIALFILAGAALPYLLGGGDQTDLEEATLPDIVSAIEAGELEALTVRGDLLVATKTDGGQLSAHKESNISTIEALQLLGASPEA
jgi:hypothetical protein